MGGGGARNRVGIGLSYRPARLHRLAGQYDNSVPSRFLAPIDCYKIPVQNLKILTLIFYPFINAQFLIACPQLSNINYKNNMKIKEYLGPYQQWSLKPQFLQRSQQV
jgi:hypothetical protein